MKIGGRVVVSIACTGALVSCGGGGGTGQAAPTGPTFDLAAANHRLLTTGGTWAATGTGSDGRAYTFTATFTPLADGVFSLTGKSGARVQRTITLAPAAPGSATDSANSTVTADTAFFDAATSALFGAENADGSCSRVDSNGRLPDAASVGAQGLLFTVAVLAACSATAVSTGSATHNWALEVDAGHTLFCQNQASQDTVSLAQTAVSYCIEVAPDGTPGTAARLSIAIPAQNFGIEARNF